MSKTFELREGQPVILQAGEGEKIDEIGNLTAKVLDAESGGGCFIFEGIIPPGEGIGLHLHRGEVEVLYMLDGEVEVQGGERVETLKKGGIGSFPINCPHRIQNVSDKPATALFFTVPGRLEGFFRAIRGVTNEADLAKIAADYETEFIIPG